MGGGLSWIVPTLVIPLTAVITGCGKNHSTPAAHVGQANTTAPSHLLEKWCSDCHAPPRPEVHTAREWPGVVAQMQRHRIVKGFGKIDDRDLYKLLNYLQDHARPQSS